MDPAMDAELRQKALDFLQKTSKEEGSGMYKTELSYFIAHQKELVEKYKGKVLAIKGEQVLGAYPDALHAYLETQKTHKVGTFMLQPCVAGASAYTITINSSNITME